MKQPRLTRFEFHIMDVFWTRGRASIRDVQHTFPETNKPAYTTIQTTVYRLEDKGVARRVGKVGNFHIFEPTISREKAQRKLIDDLLTFFGGRTRPVMAHLIESGQLTMDDIREAEHTLQQQLRKGKKS